MKFEAPSAIPSTNPKDAAPDFNTEAKKAGKMESTISEEKSLNRLVSPRMKHFSADPKFFYLHSYFVVTPAGIEPASQTRKLASLSIKWIE